MVKFSTKNRFKEAERAVQELTLAEVDQVSGAEFTYDGFLTTVGGSAETWGTIGGAFGYAWRGASMGATLGAWGAIGGAAVGFGVWTYNSW